MKNSWQQPLLLVSFIVVGATAGVAGTLAYFHTLDLKKLACIEKYALTNDSLDCNDYEDSSARLRNLDQQLGAATAQYVQDGKATRVSVWTRDLDSNQWAASNEFEQYAPASLLKLPLMIAYYKVAEIEPTILNTKLTYTPSTQLNADSQDFAPAHTLVEGQSYSVGQLIAQMITESDNNATALLLTHIDQNIFNNTMVELGIKVPGSNSTYDFVTAKTYANIFRALYNASYLTRDYSEQALELLASSSFKGIATEVPASTKVAHKFGEREIDNPDGSVQKRELHDCGIVYKSTRTYSLCIMSEGNDFANLSTILHNLSKIVYDQM